MAEQLPHRRLCCLIRTAAGIRSWRGPWCWTYDRAAFCADHPSHRLRTRSTAASRSASPRRPGRSPRWRCRLANLRPGAPARRRATGPARPRYEDRAAVDQPRRSWMRRKHVPQRAELGIDPGAVVLDEGRDLGIARAQRRHHLDAARVHGDAQAPGARAAPEIDRRPRGESGQAPRRDRASTRLPNGAAFALVDLSDHRREGMGYATTDDGVRLYYEETGAGRADRVRARVRRGSSQLGAAGPLLQPPPPLHRLRRARLSALGRAGECRRAIRKSAPPPTSAR